MARVRRRSVIIEKPKPRRFLRFLLGLFLLTGLGLAAIIFFNPLVWRLDLRLKAEKSRASSVVYDRNGAPVASLYSKTRLWVPISQIPQPLQDAFIATEDYRFFQHKGIDFRGISRALYEDIKSRSKVQGGSTITQQLVKNLFFTQEKTWFRKIAEMAYAIRIEQQYSKRQILEAYLNNIYLGHGSWGVGAAAGVYFGKAVRELNIQECALLAGLARGPEYYSPFRRPKAALERRNLVLRLMVKRGYLRQSTQAVLAQTPVKTLARPGSAYVGAYFTDYVSSLLERELRISEKELRTMGLKIYTSMDHQIQAAAEAALATLPEAGTDRWGVTQPQGAMVVLDPKTGEILALVGGRRYTESQLNRATEIYRQPGSAIKPFVFAAALEAGYTPESVFEDRPVAININGEIYQPQNYDNKYRGPISLRVALEESVNTVAVELVKNLGPSNVFILAQKMGLKSLVAQGSHNDIGLAPLALGGLTKGVTLLELTGAYTAFANRGIHTNPFGILRVYDANGALIYYGGIRRETVILPETAATLTSMMEGVITRGTGIRANIGIPAAGKTGTTNRNTNGWFIGYTQDLLAGVWIGNDQSSQPLMVKGTPLGSGTASEIWGNFMRRGLATFAAVQPYSLAPEISE
ncbi:MAG: PBP1A family penicillin-binding protein [Firmicutes bacterium]|nr:PBP1A family penicillin-binding protein [Bacillota bacterium]